MIPLPKSGGCDPQPYRLDAYGNMGNEMSFVK